MNKCCLACLGVLTLAAGLSAPVAAYTRQDQDAAIESYLSAFYTVTNEAPAPAGNFVKNDTTRDYPTSSSFWRNAEEMEMVEDAYDRTHNDKYKTTIVSLYNGFVKVNGTNWLGNNYNDDLMWITMATLRAYQITGDKTYYTQAKWCFDNTWSRAYDPIGGGVWWSTDKSSKNACIAGPAAIAALLIYQCGGGSQYLDDAKAAFNWEVKTLYEPTGLVHDNISAGVVSGGATTYNQGTFIGAAYLLDAATGNHDNEPYALAAALFTRDHRSDPNQLLDDEYSMGDGDSDNAGFKGIFVRWCGLWARKTNNHEVLAWLRRNAQTVVDRRNKAGLTWGLWDQPTPDTSVTAWECSDAVALLQDVPPIPPSSIH